MEKKNSNLEILILVIIIVILGVLCVLLATDKIKFGNKNNSSNVSSNSNVETSAVDVSKSYVYDASYSYDNKYTKYERGIGASSNVISYYGIEVEYAEGEQLLTNLKVPYFNINSSDAVKANNDMALLYNEYAEKFDNCAEEANDSSLPSCTLLLTYKLYQFDNIVSVVVIDSGQATSKWVLNYHTYNFDLTTGKNLSYDELLNKLGYNDDFVSSTFSSLVKKKMDSIEEGYDLTKACESSNDKYNTANCYDITTKLFEASISDNSILYFVDNNGKLNLLPILYFDFFQDGKINHYLITISK